LQLIICRDGWKSAHKQKKEAHRGVYRVGDDGHPRLRAVLSNPLAKACHDASVDVKQVITAHARLAGNSCKVKSHMFAKKRNHC
jgi:hypothetical protein